MRADGTGLRRLTSYGLNAAPRLSPHQRFVAYLSVPSGVDRSTRGASAHNVWLIAVDGTGATRLTPTDPHHDRTNLRWSPDGRYLAYLQGSTVQLYDLISHTTRRLYTFPPLDLHWATSPYVYAPLWDPTGGPTSYYRLAWAPDSRRLAIALVRRKTTSKGQRLRDTDLSIVVTRIGLAGTASTVTISFLPGALSQPQTAGSSPAIEDFSWASLDRPYLFATAYVGAGYGVSGIWQAPERGGPARLLVGQPADVSGGSVSRPLDYTAGFQLAPAGSPLALNSDNLLWVATAVRAQGRYLQTGVAPGCRLMQFAWLADSTGLAYVTTCREPRRTTPWHFTVSLWSIGLDGRPPQLLLRLVHSDPRAVELHFGTRFDCTEPCYD